MNEPMPDDVAIRRLEETDLEALNEVYNHFVTETHITFDHEPTSLDARRVWFRTFASSGPHQAFAAVASGQFVGWVCSHSFRSKPGYSTTVETTIYLAPGSQGRGVGKRLYRRLFEALVPEKLHRAYAGIALPNEASIALHERLGFRHVGRFNEVGHKFGRFWTVIWMEKHLGGESAPGDAGDE